MSALPMSGTRGSRHHWAGPNADPIPEHEPVRPSGAAQALLAPVRKVYCSGDTSPRSPASPTLYESYLNSPIASMEAGLDRQDSSASTSESLEHCVRGGLPRLSSGLSSSCNSSCHGSFPRAKSESNLSLFAEESVNFGWDRSILNACRRKSLDASEEVDVPREHLVRGASSALDILSQMRSSEHSLDADADASAGEAKSSQASDEAFPDSYASSSLTSGNQSQTLTDASNRTSFSSNGSLGHDTPFDHAQSHDSFMPGEPMSISPPSNHSPKSWPSSQPKPDIQEKPASFSNLSHALPSCQISKKPIRKVSLVTPYCC